MHLNCQLLGYVTQFWFIDFEKRRFCVCVFCMFNGFFFFFVLSLLQLVMFYHYPQGSGFAGWTTKEQFCLGSGSLICTGDVSPCTGVVQEGYLPMMLMEYVWGQKISHPFKCMQYKRLLKVTQNRKVGLQTAGF